IANLKNNPGTVSVLLNVTVPGATTLAFATQKTFLAGSYPAAIAMADVNGDGKPDILVANYADNTVSVLLNATSPGATAPAFLAQQTFLSGSGPDSSGPYSVFAADINGDGRPDIIIGNSYTNVSSHLYSHTVSALLNATLPGATVLAFAAQQTF